MKRFVLIAIAFLAACSPLSARPTPHPGSSQDAQLLQAPMPRLTSPDVDSDHIAALAQGNNAFAFDLYRAITETEPGNLIYSPYSISLAFSLVYAGARGQTEAQLAETLHFLSQERHHPAFNALDQHLSTLGQEPEPDENTGEAFQLNIANAVWGQAGYPFEQAYLEILAQYYGAGMRTVDFTQAAEAARGAINAWVEEQTGARIREMVGPGVIDALTRLVLVNAIYFKASWLYPFEETATQEGPFTLPDGSQVSAALMQRDTARIDYFAGDGYQAARLPYTGGAIDMLVILPDAGRFEGVEAQLSADFLGQIRQAASERDVKLVMPKLDFETDLDLKDLLLGMGMTAPFEAADFSGIAEGGGLYISDALHKANITVDEKGTEAAAATVIAMRESAAELAELILDRPFIFAILERETGSILFLGRVMNPLE